MIGALLPEGEVGGNIGVPLGELDPSAPIWILEVSSFQLHYTYRATPAILLFLPITQDHLDWHGSFENYLKAKLSPIGRMGERGVVIYPAELEREVRAHLPPAPPFLIPYTDPAQLATSFQLTPPIFQPPFDLDEVLARLVRKILHWDDPGLEGFQVAPHKVEEFRDRFGRLWVDDSKATNVDAVIGAVNRYRDRKIHLILGGVGKGQNFTPLFQQLKGLNLELYLIGETQRELGELAQKFQIGAHLVGTLERAVHQIGKELKKGEVALLSPGCASFDQFKSYRERGERFKELVLGL
jgi:UDP-N-acetylmuramoylalanine--D-glutamate ligase